MYCRGAVSEVVIGESRDNWKFVVFWGGAKRYVPTVQRAEVSTEHRAGRRSSLNSRSSVHGL